VEWNVVMSVPHGTSVTLEHDLPGGGNILGAGSLGIDDSDTDRELIRLVVAADSESEATKRAVERYSGVGAFDGRIASVRPDERPLEDESELP
jgi:hypothetical protein